MDVARTLRTLVDLLDTEHGYARIFYETDSFGYELCAYRPRPMADLFERLDGFATAADACEAARQQLLALQPARRGRARRIGR